MLVMSKDRKEQQGKGFKEFTLEYKKRRKLEKIRFLVDGFGSEQVHLPSLMFSAFSVWTHRWLSVGPVTRFYIYRVIHQ